MKQYDAVVVGSGPNGLAAAIRLSEQGFETLLLEARDAPGGGLESEALTLPGFVHDRCAAIHTMGVLSPYFNALPLAEHGLSWAVPDYSVAHPLDGSPAAMLAQDLAETAAQFGPDEARYQRWLRPFLKAPHGLLKDLLAPLGIPSNPLAMLRFGLSALWPATFTARRFQSPALRALFAGCAAHSILPFDRFGTSAFGLIFLLCGHVHPWPAVRGGSGQLAQALAGCLRALGGSLETGRRVHTLAELPPARAYLFDLSPRALSEIAGDALPTGYRKRLARYVYGPGVYKIDYALREPIPWTDPKCQHASTIHLGGTFEEIADAEARVWRGEVPERPFVLLCQQSHFDATRAPAGQHTGYAYCHVPPGYDGDAQEVIERQIERFAPGFGETVLARHITTPHDFERKNPSWVGGAVTGGAALVTQLFTRPVARLNPYTTPNPKLFLCSQSTPPGGGVHGMCGFHAAETVAKRLRTGRI